MCVRYTIKQYGFKLDSKINKYRLELILERVARQGPFDDIRRIPKPSQLDDWTLFDKLEGDKVKMLQGQPSYLEWKLRRQEERVDLEEWKRAKLIGDSFASESRRSK